MPNSLSSKTGSLATNLKDTLCLTILGLRITAIFQLFQDYLSRNNQYFWQKVANLTPQIYLCDEKYDTLAYDQAITTFAGYQIVVRQSFIGSVHRSTKLF